MEEAKKRPQGLFAGELVKSWIFNCLTCSATMHESSSVGDTMKNDAIRRARTLGWSNTKDGWICPDCNKRRRAT